jgi:hypothetical protein
LDRYGSAVKFDCWIIYGIFFLLLSSSPQMLMVFFSQA